MDDNKTNDSQNVQKPEKRTLLSLIIMFVLYFSVTVFTSFIISIIVKFVFVFLNIYETIGI